MALYLELYNLRNDSVLRGRVAMAVAIAAVGVQGESANTPNHAARLAWARTALADPDAEAARVIWVVLGTNAALTVAALMAAVNADLLAAVKACIDSFALGV